MGVAEGVWQLGVRGEGSKISKIFFSSKFQKIVTIAKNINL